MGLVHARKQWQPEDGRSHPHYSRSSTCASQSQVKPRAIYKRRHQSRHQYVSVPNSDPCATDLPIKILMNSNWLWIFVTSQADLGLGAIYRTVIALIQPSASDLVGITAFCKKDPPHLFAVYELSILDRQRSPIKSTQDLHSCHAAPCPLQQSGRERNCVGANRDRYKAPG